MTYKKWCEVTGGQAFKREHWDGITILDYFAAAAMTGLIASEKHCSRDIEVISAMAYDQARHMVNHRQEIFNEPNNV